MTSKELARYEVIKNLLRGAINGAQAAKQAGLTPRHVRRLKARVRILGARGMAHSARGKPGNRRVDEQTTAKVTELINANYPDFGPTLAAEKLWERNGIDLSVTAVKRIMVDGGIWAVKAKQPVIYRKRRSRKEHLGEMVQFDGSYHHWFEDEDEYCLLGGVDDATGRLYAQFAPHEGTIPVFAYWEKYLLQYGKPLSVYVDRLNTYKAKELSQFELAMKELGIEVIHARSPQAKGRIERTFGTLQNRLVKELRLAGIRDTIAANRFLKEVFLPGYNAKFNVAPLKKSDMHRELTSCEKANLKSILARKAFRNVNNDFTVRHNNCWYQLSEEQPVSVKPRDDVLLEERTDGKLYLLKNNRQLDYERLPERPPKILAEVKRKDRIGHPSPANHPWKSGFRVKVRVPEPLISYTY